MGDFRIIGFTARILLFSCLAIATVGTVLGLYLSFCENKKIRALLDILVSLPLVFPPIGMGFFLITLLGRNGIVGKVLHRVFNTDIVFSPAGVFIASFIAGLPLMVKSVESAAKVLDRSIMEMASLQGTNTFQKFFYIVLPNIKTGILTGISLSAGRSLGEVGMTLMLGGNIAGKTETISLAIFNAVYEGNFQKAAGLSFLLALLSVLLFLAIQRAGKEDKTILGSVFQ